MDENKQSFTKEDIEQNKVVAALAYLIFFLPLIVAKDSDFGKFHANQGLILFIAFVVSGLIQIVPLLGGFISAIIGLALVVIGVLNAVGAYNGKAEELPVIGQFNLINK